MSSKDYIKKTTVSELIHTQKHLCLALSVAGLPRWWWGKESACQCRRYETQVWSLGQEDPLEEEMTTHSSILAWRIPRTEEPCWLQSAGSQRIGHEWRDFACMHVTDNLDSSSPIILIGVQQAMRETRVRSLGWEDPLEMETATRSGILAWKIPWTEEPGRLQSMGSQRVGHDWATSLSFLSWGQAQASPVCADWTVNARPFLGPRRSAFSVEAATFSF